MTHDERASCINTIELLRQVMSTRYGLDVVDDKNCDKIIEMLINYPQWTPVSEGLPEELVPVNITWVNHEPESYYEDIKDKPFSATGIYYRGKWWWYSATAEDVLAEYGRSEFDRVFDCIEIIAWQPLPSPYREEAEEE